MEVKLVNILESPYKDVINESDVMYCEIELRRDKSSFAGMAFKVMEDNNISCVTLEERVCKVVNKYEKLHIGIDENYYNSICHIYNERKLEFGIKVFFLVYSDIRSSQIIFTKLMEWICDNINNYSA